MQNTYLIIGASAAGLSAAIKLRDLAPGAVITCLTAEQEMPYNRCLLADYLSGSRPVERIMTKPQSFFDEKNITLMRNARVVAIDRANKSVTLADGKVLTYDKLFIGAGRIGWLPDVVGSNLPGVFPFYDIADIDNILEFIKAHNVTQATVVGAGLSGLECADALALQGVQVDVVDREAHVLPRQLNREGSDVLVECMKERNVTFYPHDQVEQIDSADGRVASVRLATGKTLPTQLVVFAIGGRVNSAFAANAGITLHQNSIMVNERMQTNDEHIFAGGDVCAVPDVLTGQLTQSCLWADAAMQGMAAASNMVGTERIYPGTLIVTSSNIYGTTFVTCGPVTNPPVHFEKIERRGHNFYHLFLTHDGQLKGFAMVGNVNNVGMLRKKLIDKSQFELASFEPSK